MLLKISSLSTSENARLRVFSLVFRSVDGLGLLAVDAFEFDSLVVVKTFLLKMHGLSRISPISNEVLPDRFLSAVDLEFILMNKIKHFKKKIIKLILKLELYLLKQEKFKM